MLVDIKVSVNYNIDEKGTADKRLYLGFTKRNNYPVASKTYEVVIFLFDYSYQ